MGLIYTNPASLGLSTFLLEGRHMKDAGLLAKSFILTDCLANSLALPEQAAATRGECEMKNEGEKLGRALPGGRLGGNKHD